MQIVMYALVAHSIFISTATLAITFKVKATWFAKLNALLLLIFPILYMFGF